MMLKIRLALIEISKLIFWGIVPYFFAFILFDEFQTAVFILMCDRLAIFLMTSIIIMTGYMIGYCLDIIDVIDPEDEEYVEEKAKEEDKK